MFSRTVTQALLIFCWAFAVTCGATPASGQVMSVRQEVHHDVSPAVRDLPKIAHLLKPAIHEAEPVRRIPLPPGLKPPGQPDSVLQKTSAHLPSKPTPPIALNLPGVGQGQYGFDVEVAPPDTNGAVGLTQYVQWVNASFAVFDKSTGALKSGPNEGNSLWRGFGGGCETNNSGDGVVLYDKLANRWILAQFSVSSAADLQCVAVSTTPDATGTYYRYSFAYTEFDDYPKMAVWLDAYYVTFNMFDNASQAFLGASACAYDRTSMLNGGAAAQVCFQQAPTIGGLLPADVDGTKPPPDGSPNYLINFGSNSLNLYRFHVDFANVANSTFTGPTVINVASFSPLCDGGTCVPQPGVTQQLDSLADRLMYRLAYRNFGTHESLVVNHSVVAGNAGGIRWYEVQNPRGTPVVAQQSTFAPDSSYRWMGSIAMDKAGDIALGYSVSNSSTVFPSIAYTARAAADPASAMEAEVKVSSGAGSQNGGLSRWGDYSAMQVDPADDCTFWYTQEYLEATGSYNWSTKIVTFRFPGCVPSANALQSSSQ